VLNKYKFSLHLNEFVCSFINRPDAVKSDLGFLVELFADIWFVIVIRINCDLLASKMN
jgi:hypothetical protein